LLEQPHAGEALQADIERKLMLARWANVPQGFQASMFQPDRRPATERAREEGKTAGLAGDVCKPPYDPSVPQYQEWMEGYGIGQSVSLSFLKTLEEPAPAGDDGQMDLRERDDLPPEGQPLDVDVSNPPFMPAQEMPETPEFLRREA
jgi:hypothetical protein